MRHLLFFLLITNICAAQQQIIKYPNYTSYYNPVTKIPDSVTWVCSPHVKAVGREAGFHATGNRLSQVDDYLHSGYDIGHNADASDMNGNKDDEYNSFDYANAWPQRPNCNRLTWLALENYVRKLSDQYSTVAVKVSWHGIDGHIGRDSVTVPLYCDKEIWYDGKYEKYSMPNKDTVSLHNFNYYRIQ